jgi:hypothetical protein
MVIARPMATAAIELFRERRNQNLRKFLQDLQYQMALSGITTVWARADFFAL